MTSVFEDIEETPERQISAGVVRIRKKQDIPIEKKETQIQKKFKKRFKIKNLKGIRLRPKAIKLRRYIIKTARPTKRNILSPTVFSMKLRQTIEEGKKKKRSTYFQKGGLL